MRIEIFKKTTRFHIRKRDERILTVLFNKMQELKDFKFYWSIEGFYYINSKLEEDLIEKIKTTMKKTEIITGYFGCPVTGAEFSWKY